MYICMDDQIPFVTDDNNPCQQNKKTNSVDDEIPQSDLIWLINMVPVKFNHTSIITIAKIY